MHGKEFPKNLGTKNDGTADLPSPISERFFEILENGATQRRERTFWCWPLTILRRGPADSAIVDANHSGKGTNKK